MANEIRCTCPRCGAVQDVSFPGGVNTARDPEGKEKVRSGALFIRECPHCGTRHLVSGPFLYHDPDEKLMICLLPEGDAAEERLAALGAETGSLQGYTLRRVTDVGSLIEKIAIHEDGFDDRVMELCKYLTKLELTQGGNNPALLDAPFKYFHLEGADQRLAFTYPLDGQMQCVDTGLRVYEDCRGILQRNPSVRTESGFARIDAAWVSKYFR